MKRFKQVKTRLLLFLISGILLLSIGFLSCGTGSQTKTTVPDRGAYAVDFSAAPSQLGFIDLGRSINSMAGLTEFTVEAWVKRNTSGVLEGAIFSRSGNIDTSVPPDGIDDVGDGIVLYIDVNRPTVIMVIAGSPYSVTSTTSLTNGQWTHIAGVLHAAVHGSCSSPHLDIYVGGTFNNCANATYPAAFSYNERIGRPHSSFDPGSGPPTAIEAIDTKLNAVVDEVRFWKVARTASQIQTWMNKEITETNWNQANPNDALIGYWMLNEGAGTAIIDSSGIGNGGTKDYCDCVNYVCTDSLGTTIVGCESGGNSILWEGGWTTGKPF